MLMVFDPLAKWNAFPKASLPSAPLSAFQSLLSRYSLFDTFPPRILSSLAGSLGIVLNAFTRSLACVSSFLGLPRLRLTCESKSCCLPGFSQLWSGLYSVLTAGSCCVIVVFCSTVELACWALYKVLLVNVFSLSLFLCSFKHAETYTLYMKLAVELIQQEEETPKLDLTDCDCANSGCWLL